MDSSECTENGNTRISTEKLYAEYIRKSAEYAEYVCTWVDYTVDSSRVSVQPGVVIGGVCE